MGYVQDNLMPGERIVDYAPLHRGIFIAPILLAAAGIVGTLVMALVANDVTVTLCCGGLLLLPGVIWLASSLVTFVTTEFAVTNRRVIGKVGFVRRHSMELPLAKVESVQAHQGIVGRMLNYGTIMVRGSGGSTLPVPFIEDPQTFRNRINAAIAAPPA